MWAELLNNSKKDPLTLRREPLKQGGRVWGQNLQHFTLNFDLSRENCPYERTHGKRTDEKRIAKPFITKWPSA